MRCSVSQWCVAVHVALGNMVKFGPADVTGQSNAYSVAESIYSQRSLSQARNFVNAAMG